MRKLMNMNKLMKWFGALLAVMLLLAVSITGAVAEEEGGLIAEQIENEVILTAEAPEEAQPAEEQQSLLTDEPESAPEPEAIAALPAPEADAEELPEVAAEQETAEEPEEAEESEEAELPAIEAVAEALPEITAEQEGSTIAERPVAETIEETEAVEETEESEETEAVAETEETEAVAETEETEAVAETEESETIEDSEVTKEDPAAEEAQESEQPEAENAAEGSTEAVPEAQTEPNATGDQEEETNFKNGNEGLHKETSSGTGFYDGKFNAGMHLNDNESGRNVDVNLMHVQISTGANAGEFIALTPNNVVVHGKGYHAGVNAEITVLETSADFRFGNTKNNFHGSFDIEAGSLKGGAEFTAGVVNGNAVVGVTVSGEADLVTVKISGGGTVGGVKVDGHVGAKLGVGGRFQAGVHDGKFGIHGSFAVGIGFEAGVDVDLSSVTNKLLKIEETVSSVKNWFKSLW